jgi:hypothetical protein
MLGFISFGVIESLPFANQSKFSEEEALIEKKYKVYFIQCWALVKKCSGLDTEVPLKGTVLLNL